MSSVNRASQVRRLVQRDGTRCHYCGVELDFDGDENSRNYRTVDHIHPQILGGDNRLNNLVLACRVCNSQKRTKHYQQFRMVRETDSIILWLMEGEQ